MTNRVFGNSAILSLATVKTKAQKTFFIKMFEDKNICQKTALAVPLSGNFNNGSANNQGDNGNFWSSTRNNNNNMYNLYANTDEVNPVDNNNRNNGNSVRCLVQ